MLLDCIETSEFWNARMPWIEGIRDMPGDDVLQMNDQRIVAYKGKGQGKKASAI